MYKPQLKERLFEEVDLILDKTITISKALDLPKIQAKELRSNQTTNLSSEVQLVINIKYKNLSFFCSIYVILESFSCY